MTARGLIIAVSLLGAAAAYGESAGEGANAVLVAPFISGSSVYSARQLSSVYSAQIGQPTARVIRSIIESIESQYRDDGFVAPVVTVADGAQSSSTPRLQIHEAAVTDVRLLGNAGPHQQALQQSLHVLATLRPLRKDRVRETLSALQRLPGVGVRASFEPSATQLNGFTLVIEVAYHPVSASVAAANRGTRASGRDLVSGRLTLNGFLRQREFLTLEGAASTAFDQYHYAGVGATRGFGTAWASLFVSNSHARPWAASDVYERNRYAIQLLAPIQDAQSVRLSAVTRFVATDSALKNDEFGPLSRERLRKIEAGLSMIRKSADAAPARLAATVVRGVCAFGASAVSYDDVPAPNPVFTKLLLQGERGYALPRDFELAGRFTGEYAFSAIPSSEQFVFGGARFGRGLEAADLAGEHGVALSLDLERPGPRGVGWLGSTTIYSSVDYGYAWTTNAGAVRDHAASTSVGFTVERSGFNSAFELAYPLHRPRFTETQPTLAAFLEFEWTL
jgi:hemolysin activation/secretion protein